MKVAKSTAYHLVKKFKDLGTSKDRPRSERSLTKKIKTVQEMVRRNSKRSARQVAKEMNVSVTSMRRVIKNYLMLLPYKMWMRQNLKEKRLDRAKIFLRNWKAGTTKREIVFSDEKLFTIETSVKNQNDRVYLNSLAFIHESVITVYHRQKSFSLMVWASFTSDFLYNRGLRSTHTSTLIILRFHLSTRQKTYQCF